LSSHARTEEQLADRLLLHYERFHPTTFLI